MNEFHPVNWDFIFLRQNPFPTTPPRRPEEAVWAGFQKLKKQLNILFTEALTTSRTQVVLNRGEYGSGKTHAAVYFRRPERLPSLDTRQISEAQIFYIRTPREPEKADMLLYRSIIEAVRFRNLRNVISAIIQTEGEKPALEKLQNTVESEALGRALWLLGYEKKKNNQLSLFEKDDGNAEWQRLLEAWFYSQTTKNDLRKLGLSRNVDSAQDRFHLLGGILQALIGLAPAASIETHRRIILWIDEMENLIYYPSRYYNPFTQGLRDLVDQLPNYFTMMMNFTLASPEELEDIRTVLGKALLDRITHQIYFQEPDEEEAFDYVQDLLRLYRTENWNTVNLPDTYPFEEDALRLLIDTLSTRTPRDLNQACARTVSLALQRGEINGIGQGQITRQFIRQLQKEQIDLEMG